MSLKQDRNPSDKNSQALSGHASRHEQDEIEVILEPETSSNHNILLTHGVKSKPEEDV